MIIVVKRRDVCAINSGSNKKIKLIGLIVAPPEAV
jgi:hypothetical protein